MGFEWVSVKFPNNYIIFRNDTCGPFLVWEWGIAPSTMGCVIIRPFQFAQYRDQHVVVWPPSLSPCCINGSLCSFFYGTWCYFAFKLWIYLWNEPVCISVWTSSASHVRSAVGHWLFPSWNRPIAWAHGVWVKPPEAGPFIQLVNILLPSLCLSPQLPSCLPLMRPFPFN